MNAMRDARAMRLQGAMTMGEESMKAKARGDTRTMAKGDTMPNATAKRDT